MTPHHLALSDAVLQGYDPVFKVKPPLRGVADVTALRAGLTSGVIDAIATDHAPHAPERKEEPFDEAPSGMLGLETALAVAYGALCLAPGQSDEQADSGWVPPGPGPGVPLGELFGWFSWKPARIAGLYEEAEGPLGRRGGQGGPINPGASRTCACSTRARHGSSTPPPRPAAVTTRPGRAAASPAKCATACSRAR